MHDSGRIHFSLYTWILVAAVHSLTLPHAVHTDRLNDRGRCSLKHQRADLLVWVHSLLFRSTKLLHHAMPPYYYVGSASLDDLTFWSLMSRYLVSAREGCLDQLFHVFANLKNHRSTMAFDDSYPAFGDAKFSDCDLTDLYPGASEPMPEKMPVPHGKHVVMSCFVDADHAGCRETRRSHSGIII